MDDTPQAVVTSVPELAIQHRSMVERFEMPNEPTQSFHEGDTVGMKENGKWLYGDVVRVDKSNDDFLYDLELKTGGNKVGVPQKQLKLKQRAKHN